MATIKYKTDPEFRALIPPHSSEELEGLEKDIVDYGGCHQPVSVWDHDGKLILLDGHTRVEICRKHHLPPPESTTIDGLNTREDAWNWVIDHQLHQRNLSEANKAYLMGKRLATEKQQGARTDLTPGSGEGTAGSPHLFRVGRSA